MDKFFGTDGIRGTANIYPMTPEMALEVGRAAAYKFRKSGRKAAIVVGKDTRVSGDMLESALISGICSAGADSCAVGVIPTPAVAYITRYLKADAGIVISASHNPFYDNGIKLFKGDGFKLSDKQESEIENMILENKGFPEDDSVTGLKSAVEPGVVKKISDADEIYLKFLKNSLSSNCSFNGMKIVLDCSNGATYKIAPRFFTELGAKVEAISINPDGKNINKDCGSEHTQTLIEKVLKTGAHAGFAFDGDGDRLIAVDEKGNVITGDQIIAICANYLKQKNRLKNNTVVSTVMSNMGLGAALKNLKIRHIMAKVGDRHVMEKMLSSGAVMGGEDSGHMIFFDHHTTGDGILSAIKLMEAMICKSEPLSELSKVMTVFPQALINVEVKAKPDLGENRKINNAVKYVEAELGKEGRVLVRYSGTQQICRVMVEGPEIDETRSCCQKISDVIKGEIGA